MTMTDAEWADRRDMITWLNQAVTEERRRITQLIHAEAGRIRTLDSSWDPEAEADALDRFAELLEETA